MQTNWAQQINPVLALPTNKGLLLQSVSLTTGDNVIDHKLGRKLQGWQIVRQRASAALYDKQDANQMPALTLVLNTSANVTVDLFVF